MFSIKERQKYIERLNYRFKIKSNLYNGENEYKFCYKFMEVIREQYTKIIEEEKKIGNLKYVEYEMDRLKEELEYGKNIRNNNSILKELSKTFFNTMTNGINTIITIIITVITLGVNSSKDSIDNKSELLTVISDFGFSFGSSAINIIIFIGALSMIAKYIIIKAQQSDENEKLIDVKFDRYCFNILKSISEE